MMAHRLSVLVCLALAALSVVPAGAADPFYENLLRQGIQVRQRQADPARAAKLLRLACFGLLDEPATLARCLVHLSLAQAAAGDDEGLRRSVGRLADLEQRFRALSAAALEPEVREELDHELAARELDLPPAAAIDGGRSRARTGAPADKTVEPPFGETGNPTAALDLQILEAREALRTATSRDELLDLLPGLRLAAGKNPEYSEIQLVVAEVAYRLRRWDESVAYFRRGRVDAGRPVLLFYYAVALYESGDRESAAEALQRCLPLLQQTDFIRGYAAKILGSP